MHLNITLIGANGRMGKAISNLHKPALAIGRQDTLSSESLSQCDVTLDVSTTENLSNILKLCILTKTPLVNGVTGYSDQALGQIKDASKHIPIIHANNFSLGMNVLYKFCQMSADALEGFSPHIREIHHKNKKDSPSGSALEMASIIESSSHFKNKPTPIEAIRSGSIKGEHQLLWIGEDESIEIQYRNFDRASYAKGALQAAQWIKNKTPGLYSMSDVFWG